MKKRFTEEPVLLMPDQSKPFQIESDASKVATGTVLTQLNSNGDRHPIAFLSKTFSETERKYEIYDRELLGIIRALREWRHYIQYGRQLVRRHRMLVKQFLQHSALGF
jgi:RNase H-like domain found in reverse transcriptase